ncbi:hypothetical protein [Rhizosaccharibacter radicis]|uniref:DUF2127 domain-containing protein n=1 Tax=Rhizosaccharibacter radicis TaxID=2782605 RepID=A0ABT1VVY6_9PROT|nr:hypothetical protein [Acetobacteraceae bacterium KSS12]
MLFSILDRLRSIYRREHWWAEAWSAVVLIGYGLTALRATPDHLLALASSAGLAKLLPHGWWQVAVAVFGFYQLATLAVDWRWPRAVAAFFATFVAAWVTLDLFVYGHGVQPGIWLGLGWVGVNMFATSRAVRGVR